MNNIDIVVGQTLLVELEGECLVGELTHLCSGRTFIRLSNVRDLATNKQHGSQAYYNSEIRNIQILNHTAKSTDASLANTTSKVSVKTATTDLGNTKQISFGCLNETLAQIEKLVFIHQTDGKYHKAIKFLQKQRELAFSMECIEEGRHAKSPSLLSIATFEWIFVFDIKWIKITKDIGDLLSSDRHRRVIHNGRLMRDVVHHRFGVPMGKCFDTMIAHIAITKAERKLHNDVPTDSPNLELTIQTCVDKYFRLPEKFFNADIDFDERPLKNEGKKEAAKNVAFLLPLYDHFVHEIMLDPFYESCRMYAESLVKNTDFIDSLAVMRGNRNDVIQAVKPFSTSTSSWNH